MQCTSVLVQGGRCTLEERSRWLVDHRDWKTKSGGLVAVVKA
jgi:hypothetical protein